MLIYYELLLLLLLRIHISDGKMYLKNTRDSPRANVNVHINQWRCTNGKRHVLKMNSKYKYNFNFN